MDLEVWGLLYAVGLLIVLPFLTPLLTSIVVGWVLRMHASALRWGSLSGVLGVPLSLAFLEFWKGDASLPVSLAVSALATALFLWWRSRARPHRS